MLSHSKTDVATVEDSINVVADYGVAQTLSQLQLSGFAISIACHSDTINTSDNISEDEEESEKKLNRQILGIITQSYTLEQDTFVQKLIDIMDSKHGFDKNSFLEAPQSLYAPIGRHHLSSSSWDHYINKLENRNKFLTQKFGI